MGEALPGGGWRSMDDAPRDGSIIEIENNWGVVPHWSLYRWEIDDWRGCGAGHPERDGHWQDQFGPCFPIEGSHLSWRPYNGDPSAYIRPRVADEFEYYWSRPSGRNVLGYPGSIGLMTAACQAAQIPLRPVKRSLARMRD